MMQPTHFWKSQQYTKLYSKNHRAFEKSGVKTQHLKLFQWHIKKKEYRKLVKAVA